MTGKCWWQRAAAVGLVLSLAAAFAPASRAAWGRPFRFAPPAALDVLPAAIAFSPGGTAAVTFAVQNVDAPSRSSAFATLRSAGGMLTPPRRVPGAQEILDSVYDHSAFWLLTGTSPSHQPCCSSAQVVGLATGRRGALGHPVSVIGNLTGPTVGHLLALSDRRLLAAIATPSGVWVAQSVRGNRFGAPHRLTAPGAQPRALVATSLGGDGSIVAWISSYGPLDGPGAASIFVATGSQSRSPYRGVAVLTVPRGHGIDHLALARGAHGATVAWVESFYDARGRYRSEVVAGDLIGGVRSRRVTPLDEVASGVSLAGDARGDQVLSWKACTSSGECSAQASFRRAEGRFDGPERLGLIDASQVPAPTVSPGGEALVGWIGNGRVLVADRRAGAPHFASRTVVSPTDLASDLTLSFGPAKQAIAAWTQGTFAPSVNGAVYRGP